MGESATADPLVISVVIPTRNRRDSLLGTVRSLSDQDIERGAFEVIVVIDGSDDGTAAALRESRIDLPLHIIEQEHLGQAAARNHGAREAEGNVLMFIDDDMVLSPNYLSKVTETLNSGVDVVLTTVRVGDWVPHNLVTNEIRVWDEEQRQLLARREATFGDLLFTGHAVRREKFLAVGGFDEAFTAGGTYGNEDLELGKRLLDAGVSVGFQPAARAQADAVADPPTLLRRSEEAGRNDVRLVRKHPDIVGEVFGAKFSYSRMHRAIAPLVLPMPWLGGLLGPIGRLLGRSVSGSRATSTIWAAILYRMWFVVRESQYWAGVSRAGGRDLVALARRIQAAR